MTNQSLKEEPIDINKIDQLNYLVQNNLIPIAEMLIINSAEISEKFKILNNEILIYFNIEKDYKIKEMLIRKNISV